MNVMGCLICCNNLSSVVEDCPKGWTSKYVDNDAAVRGQQYWSQEIGFMQHWTYWEHKIYAHMSAQLFQTLANDDILARCRAGKQKKTIM